MKAKAFLPFLFLIAVGLASLASLSALAAEAPSSSPFSPALIPSLTPAQAMTIQEAVRKGEKTLRPKPYDWKKSVSAPRLFLSRLQKEEAKQLTHFGHELFDPRLEREKPTGPVAYPVADDFVVGPGDATVVR